MITRQKGYTLIELMVAAAIMAVAGVVAGMAIYQVFGGTEGNNDRLTAIHQVQNAGYWISRDAQMAVSINATDQLAFPLFLQLGWTEWNEDGDAVYHLAEYSLIPDSGDIYSLVRTHTSTDGPEEEMLVARFIYYLPGMEYTSNSTYMNPDLVLNLTSVYDQIRETREYRVKRRAGL